MMLSAPEIINIILCILSFILAVISVVIVILTLRQNNKMIEASTRPYITVYGALTNFQNPIYYIVIKNFGKTGAVITKIETDFDLIEASYSDKHRPFDHIINTMIAPDQSFTSAIKIKVLKEKDIDNINFTLEYSVGKKVYTDSIVLNTEAYSDLILPKASTNGKELQIISYTLQGMVQNNL